ncbi:MAG: hypothetical protein JO149_09660 [Gammaproteobacteria bacterium]|nr:hypothetical protein [Gammaproteobacteria bacterium]
MSCDYFRSFAAISGVSVGRILTSKAQHEGRVRAIVKIRPTLTPEIASYFAGAGPKIYL